MTDLEKLHKFFINNQRLPSYEEMKKIFNVASKNTVAQRINKLLKSGDLKKKGRYLLLTNLTPSKRN